jgi:hypothetical protein
VVAGELRTIGLLASGGSVTDDTATRPGPISRNHTFR